MLIEFDEKEGNAIINILDIATKAKGLEVAETTNYFYNKFRAAYAKDKELEEKTETPL